MNQISKLSTRKRNKYQRCAVSGNFAWNYFLFSGNSALHKRIRKAHSFRKFWPYWITSLKYYKVTRSIWKLTSPPTLDPKVGCPQKFPLQPENNQSLDGTKNPNIIQRVRCLVREAFSYGIRRISPMIQWSTALWLPNIYIFFWYSL